MQSRYVEVSNPENILGKIRVETCRWTVDGPFKVHEFRFIMEAQTLLRFIKHDNIVEYYIDEKLIDSFMWGHGQTEAYRSSKNLIIDKNRKCYHTDLISCNILRNDLPCCGGVFVSSKEITDYCTLSIGHCSKCRKRWNITDGLHFSYSDHEM